MFSLELIINKCADTETLRSDSPTFSSLMLTLFICAVIVLSVWCCIIFFVGCLKHSNRKGSRPDITWKRGDAETNHGSRGLSFLSPGVTFFHPPSGTVARLIQLGDVLSFILGIGKRLCLEFRLPLLELAEFILEACSRDHNNQR